MNITVQQDHELDIDAYCRHCGEVVTLDVDNTYSGIKVWVDFEAGVEGGCEHCGRKT